MHGSLPRGTGSSAVRHPRLASEGDARPGRATCVPPHASLLGFRRSCTLRQAHFLLHAFQDGMISCAPLDRGSPLAPHCAPCRCDRTHAHLVHVLVHADAHICSYLQVAVICRSDMQVGHFRPTRPRPAAAALRRAAAVHHETRRWTRPSSTATRALRAATPMPTYAADHALSRRTHRTRHR